jgi:hypothetical protein
MNTIVSAAAVASASAISSPSNAGAPSMPIEDRRLLKIEAKARERHSGHQKISDDHSRAEDAEVGWKRQNPRPKLTDRAAVEEWERRYKAFRKEIGYDKAERAWDRAIEAINTLLNAAAEIPAGSEAGLQCKARLVNEIDPEHESLRDSIVEDLLALQRERPAEVGGFDLASPLPDPILALIEQHRGAYAEYCRLSDGPEDCNDDHPCWKFFYEAEEAAQLLTRVEPSSLAGCHALLDYWQAVSGDEDNHQIFPTDAGNGRVGPSDDFYGLAFAQSLVANVTRALAKLDAGA